MGWIYLIGLVALVLAVVGVITAVNVHDSNIDKRAYDRGKSETEKKYLDRDNQQLRDANDQIQKLQNAARAAEQEHQQQVASLTLKLSKELKANESLKQADRVAIRDGTLRLRDPGQRTASAANCVASPGAAPVTAATGSDGTAGSELSNSASEFLLDEANRADGAIAQLTAAQTLILAQIKTCNGASH